MKPSPSSACADRADAAVHHVGGRDDVAAGFGLHQRLLDQHFDGFVIEDHAVAQQAVMAVAGIGIERDIAEDADVGHFFLDRADGAADEIVRIERFAAVVVAQTRIGIGKERDAGDGEFRGAFGFAHDLIDREAFDARHGGDRHAGFLSVGDKKRPDQVGGRERVLAHHAADPVGAAQAARALGQIEPGRALPDAAGSIGTTRVRLSMGRPYLMAMRELR